MIDQVLIVAGVMFFMWLCCGTAWYLRYVRFAFWLGLVPAGVVTWFLPDWKVFLAVVWLPLVLAVWLIVDDSRDRRAARMDAERAKAEV